MRILQISNFYPPYWVGGYEQIAQWVTQGLRERGHTVHVLTGRGAAFAGRDEIIGELDLDLAHVRDAYFSGVIASPRGALRKLAWHIFNWHNYRAARRAIDRLRPDLVSFWNPALITFSPLVAARAARVPSIAHLSDQVVNPLRATGRNGAFWGLARLGADLVLRAARPDRFVVPSAFLKAKFTSLEGLPAERLDILHWPIEPSISSREAPSRAAPGPPRLLFVGTLIPEKGVDVLLAAFRLAASACPGLTLTVVGDGPRSELERLRDQAQGLPVRFAGRLDRAGVIHAYEEHDILVFPSVWEEPYAVVPPEGMAMGLAVVATAAGGTPEAVVHEETGLLVPRRDQAALAEALVRLARDPVLTHRLAGAGQAWMRDRHSFPAFMDRLEGLYEDVVAKRGAA